jgi:hypothetical protein
MANWNSKELQTPPAIKKIGQNAQNVINNLDILLKLVKQGADVAKLFLLLSNPAGAIIKLAADEIIKLCNDFKEIGVFYLFINPNDESYGGQTTREFGLAIKQDENGLYQFEPSIASSGPAGTNIKLEVGTAYQKTLDIADLASNYRDKFGRDKNDPRFEPPTPIFPKKIEWELGGYDPTTWTGHAPVTSIPLANGIFPPEMKPSKVLSIMSESFDDEGDVSVFEVKPGSKNDARSASKIYTASGAAIDKHKFDANRLQTEALYLKPPTIGLGTPFGRTLTLEEREEITTLVQSGKPNFAGSSNIQGVEVIAIVALVGVESYQKFVDAFKSLNGLFGGMPSLSEFTDDISAIYEKATAPQGEPMTIINDTRWGTFEEGDYIVGQKSGAKGQISEIVKTEDYPIKKIMSTPVKLEDGTVEIFKTFVDSNSSQEIKKLDIKVHMYGAETFFPDERIFEGVKTPPVPASHHGPEVPGKIIVKAAKGSALDPNIPYLNVNTNDVASWGQVLGIDTAAPDSIHPDWTSIKIKDVIPHYGDFFDEIIQFAEGLKGYAAAADEFIARIIKLIDDTIAEFEEIVNKIKAFLALFTTGLPGAGIYWLTIKTFGGNKAIQDALTGSDDAPPETLNFCAGFIMVSVSGMQGLSATKGLELLFGNNGFGLEFQEVAPIPETSELDTAVLKLEDEYEAAKAAQIEFATDVFDVLGLNPPIRFRDATTIKFTGWNGVEPNVGDYVLGTKSGAFGQILAFSATGNELVLDHIKIGPTIAGTQEDTERIVRQLDVTSDTYIEFPYDGSVPDAKTLAYVSRINDDNPDLLFPLVGEGRFTEEVLVNRSSHKPNGIGTTVYEVFQGNEGTFVGVDDVEEEITALQLKWSMHSKEPFNTFGQGRTMLQQVFKVINGAVKEPELESGYNGRYGYFTGDDTIISFSEELAQTFLTDIEGRNTESDKITRLKPPPTVDSYYENKMSVVVDGDDSISITDSGGIVDSYALALNNEVNPNNLPETAQEATQRKRSSN